MTSQKRRLTCLDLGSEDELATSDVDPPRKLVRRRPSPSPEPLLIPTAARSHRKIPSKRKPKPPFVMPVAITATKKQENDKPTAATDDGHVSNYTATSATSHTRVSPQSQPRTRFKPSLPELDDPYDLPCTPARVRQAPPTPPYTSPLLGENIDWSQFDAALTTSSPSVQRHKTLQNVSTRRYLRVTRAGSRHLQAGRTETVQNMEGLAGEEHRRASVEEPGHAALDGAPS